MVDTSNPFHVPSTSTLTSLNHNTTSTSTSRSGAGAGADAVACDIPVRSRSQLHPAVRSKLHGPSTDSPRTTARNQSRFGGLFASLGLTASGTGSPLRPIQPHSTTRGASATAIRSQLGNFGDDSRYETPKKAGHGADSDFGTGSKAAGDGGGVWSFAERMKALTLGTPTSVKRKTKGKEPISECEEEDGRDEDDDGELGGGGLGDGLMCLPDEILLAILLNLPPTLAELHNVSLISRRFYDLSRTPILWLRIFHEAGFHLTEEAAARGLAVEYPPEGEWDGLHWKNVPSQEEEEEEVLSDSESDDVRETQEFNHTASIPIHYPTLVRSRFLLREALKLSSSAYRPTSALLQGDEDTTYCVKETGGWILTGSRDKSIGVWRDSPLIVPGIDSNQPVNMRLPRSNAKSQSILKKNSDSDSNSDSDLNSVNESGTIPVTSSSIRRIGTIANAHERSILAIDAEIDREGRGVLVTASSDSTVKVWEVDLSGIRSINRDSASKENPNTDKLSRAGNDAEKSKVGDDDPGELHDQRGVDLTDPIKLISTIRGPSTAVLDVLSTTRYIVTASKDHLIRVYNSPRTSMSTGTSTSKTFDLVRILEGHTNSVNSLALSPPGWHPHHHPHPHPLSQSQSSSNTAFASPAGVPVPLADPTSASASTPARTAEEDDEERRGSGEFVVSASGDGEWIIWDLESGEKVQSGGAGRGLACVHWKGDHIVTGDNDKLVKLYNASTGELSRTFAGHTDLVRSVMMGEEEGVIFSGSYDKTIRMWDVQSGECIRVLNKAEEDDGGGGGSVAFDLEFKVNKLFAARQDGCLQVISWGDDLPYNQLFA
ncbi:hypothetical protein IAT40_003567 [Kwoniella sp. CBS 6097]